MVSCSQAYKGEVIDGLPCSTPAVAPVTFSQSTSLLSRPPLVVRWWFSSSPARRVALRILPRSDRRSDVEMWLSPHPFFCWLAFVLKTSRISATSGDVQTSQQAL
ncbi:hypothetical protein F2Q69_00031901 [Brassica cretica]|uniref:Uncharacterized protein n=1 Tax=Brassica cretica TaxID=69181 RepID=A0A8S9RXQ8_BRACR|nr:hypothetical protein F2Q69_00031901 [Brassica cretica]